MRHEITASRFVIDEKQRSFLARWVQKTLALDPYTTETDIKEAFTFVRGKAIEEYKELMMLLQPLSRLTKDKTLTRGVKTISTNFIVMAQPSFVLQQKRRNGSSETLRKRYAINLHFEVVPPTTENEIYANPNGIFITHFAIRKTQ